MRRLFIQLALLCAALSLASCGDGEDIVALEPNATMVSGYSISRNSVAASEEGILKWLREIDILD